MEFDSRNRVLGSLMILISITQLIRADWFSIEIIVLPLLIISRFFFVYKKISLGPCQFLYLMYLEATFFLLPFFVFSPPGELRYLSASDLLVTTNAIGYTLIFCTYLFFLSKITSSFRSLVPRAYYAKSKYPLYIGTILVVTMFASSILSKKLGITTMGSETASHLPFKIAGLLNVLRIYIFPYVSFCVIAYFIVLRMKKPLALAILVFAAWTLLESYLRVSKGVFLRNFLPIILFFFFLNLMNFKKWLVVLSVVLPIFVTLFLAGDTIRQLNFLKKEITIQNVIDRTEYRLSYNPNHFYFYQRIFPTGIEIMKYLNYDKQLFHLNIARFFESKGNANFHTRVLDRVDANGAGQFHSSGIGGLSDGYFLAGMSGLVLSGIIFCIIFGFIDNCIDDFSVKSMMFLFALDFLFGGVGLYSYLFFGTILLKFVFPVCLVTHSLCIWKNNQLFDRG